MNDKLKENIMYNIEEDQVLMKKSLYKLQGPDDIMNIEVIQVIQGQSDHKFLARPIESIIPLNRPCTVEFYGEADTEEEALKLCIGAIKGKSKEELFPKKD